MNKTLYIITMLFLGLIIFSCGGSKEESSDKLSETLTYGEAKVEIYYFHGDRRCPNCNAIEDVAKSVVYEDFKNNEDVEFFAINFEKNYNREIAKKYGINMSSLVVASQDEFIDLTIDAFQHAMSNPDYLKSEMIDVIENYLQ